MGSQTMDSTERAMGILEAWERRDPALLEAELNRTEKACSTLGLANYEEQERLELLDGIASRMRMEIPLLSQPGDRSVSVETCHRLLSHLASTGKRPVIRSEKLSFCLY